MNRRRSFTGFVSAHVMCGVTHVPGHLLPIYPDFSARSPRDRGQVRGRGLGSTRRAADDVSDKTPLQVLSATSSVAEGASRRATRQPARAGSSQGAAPRGLPGGSAGKTRYPWARGPGSWRMRPQAGATVRAPSVTRKRARAAAETTCCAAITGESHERGPGLGVGGPQRRDLTAHALIQIPPIQVLARRSERHSRA